MAVPVAAAALHSGRRPSFWRIIGKVWEPGLVLACQGVGFAAIGAFLPLFFLSRGWTNAGLGFTCFGGSYVLVRILFGHLPDRLGAVPVALMSMAVEATGQYFLWSASSPTAALVGACLTGMGCSLIYPAMGIEVVRRVAPHLRGTATGGFTAFQDLAYGLTGPATGLLADRFGYGVVFLIGGLTATVGFALVIAIARKDPELIS
jgi:MFS family permease